MKVVALAAIIDSLRVSIDTLKELKTSLNNSDELCPRDLEYVETEISRLETIIAEIVNLLAAEAKAEQSA